MSIQPPSPQSEYLYPGMIFAHAEPHHVTTVLGTCVSVCLWDRKLQIGGINHFIMPLWDGQGLASPRFGNVAIVRLVEKMQGLGSRRHNLVAKVFGGKEVGDDRLHPINIGWRNACVALEHLERLAIRVVARELGGNCGRKVTFETHSGSVRVKRFIN